MTTFLTADTHFGHASIIRHCERPYAGVGEMDAALVQNWNRTVRPQDTVYHLGDFGHRDPTANARVFPRLNGRKHLVLGNHDSAEDMARLGWESVSQYLTVTVNGVLFVMFHYPIVEWERYFRNGNGQVGSIDVFGHVHSTPSRPKHDWDTYQYDVGVDNNAFCPVSTDHVVRMIKAKADALVAA